MTAGKAQTPHQSDDDEQQDIRDEMQSHEQEDSGSHLQHTQNEDNDRPQVGRQKAVAAVPNVHPPDMLAKLTWALKKSNLRVIEDVRSHYAVSAGEQPDGILSDELRVGTKRSAAAISRSEYEIYSFATRHDLSEAATDELIQLVSNVRFLFMVVLDAWLYISDAVKYKQVRFQPEDFVHKTMKSMDRAARLAMLPDYDIYCVDLKEGNVI